MAENKTMQVVEEIRKSVTELNIADMQKIAEKRGVTIEAIFDKGKEMLSAKKAIMNKFGDVSYEDDNVTQLKAVELFLNVFKVLEKKEEDNKIVIQHRINFDKEEMENYKKIAQEMKELFKKHKQRQDIEDAELIK